MDSRISKIDAKIKYLKILVELRNHKQFVEDVIDIIGSNSTHDPNYAVFKEGQRSVVNWFLSNHNVSIKDLENQKLDLINELKLKEQGLNIHQDQVDLGVRI